MYPLFLEVQIQQLLSILSTSEVCGFLSHDTQTLWLVQEVPKWYVTRSAHQGCCMPCFVSPHFIAYSCWPLLGTYNWVGWFWTDAVWRSSANTSTPRILTLAVLAVPTLLSISCSQELLCLQCWKNPQNLTDSNYILYLDFLEANFCISYSLGTVCIADEISQVIKTFCDILHSAAGNPVLKWEDWGKKKSKYLIIALGMP